MSKAKLYATQLRETLLGDAYYGSAFLYPLVFCNNVLSSDERLCLLRYQSGTNTEDDYFEALDIADKLESN